MGWVVAAFLFGLFVGYILSAKACEKVIKAYKDKLDEANKRDEQNGFDKHI
jgi:predicted DNA-binding transcriptional regulator